MEYPLVTTAWLEENLNRKDLILLDASMNSVVDKEPIIYDEFICIANARMLELEKDFCNPESSQLHALPTEQQFSRSAQKLGINSDSLLVIYDNQGIYSSPRAWWTFKAMGFDNVYVLDGGLPKWLAEGGKTANTFDQDFPQPGNVIGQYRDELVCDSDYVQNCINSHKTAIVDARASKRFAGKAPEPRKGVRSGHIPNSLNLPFSQLLESHGFKNAKDINNVFSTLVAETNEQLVFTCGSGITACIVLLAAVVAGYPRVVLYDGSWADWGSDQNLPIESSAVSNA
ncbi:sulfurtransferase [Thalassotalea sp. ND16A]|uniref:sulfurtransferase n=1 Tax=Thalassotalea sp. ND16A TaxID=1535422 RepID=UPI00051A1277|nr:sulfurtransferase [Thalassotalea sp. ND16A]KGJ90272.1 3-mercaptopyruvate sulfurtransferase [Thalassotalea sp. ND16A]